MWPSACTTPLYCSIDDNHAVTAGTITLQTETYELVTTPQSNDTLILDSVTVHMASTQLAQLKLGIYAHDAQNPNDNPDLEGPLAGVFTSSPLNSADPNSPMLFDFSGSGGVTVSANAAYFFTLVLDGYQPVQISINETATQPYVLQTRTSYDTWGPAADANARLAMDIEYSHVCGSK